MTNLHYSRNDGRHFASPVSMGAPKNPPFVAGNQPALEGRRVDIPQGGHMCQFDGGWRAGLGTIKVRRRFGADE
ncbi:MAG: hypothetical protein K2P58_03430 [Hyphomonadaceae bacterium]|nr:hypothetical protein [Hyphomonadaceae bacterium]